MGGAIVVDALVVDAHADSARVNSALVAKGFAATAAGESAAELRVACIIARSTLFHSSSSRRAERLLRNGGVGVSSTTNRRYKRRRGCRKRRSLRTRRYCNFTAHGSESLRSLRRLHYLQRTLGIQRRVARVHERELVKISVRRNARWLRQCGRVSDSCCSCSLSRRPRHGVATHWEAHCWLLLRRHTRRTHGSGTALEAARLMRLRPCVSRHHRGRRGSIRGAHTHGRGRRQRWSARARPGKRRRRLSTHWLPHGRSGGRRRGSFCRSTRVLDRDICGGD